MTKRTLVILLLGLQRGLVLLVILLPLVWLFVSSLMSVEGGFGFRNYANAVERLRFFDYVVNSFTISIFSVGLALGVGTLVSAVSCEYRLTWLPFVTLVSRMAPGTLYLFPLFVLYTNLGLYGSHLGLILAHFVLVLPLVVWITLPFFEAVPVEVKESAKLDGCSPGQLFLKITLPLASPGIIVAAILSFITSWNYFLFAVALSSSSSKPLTVAIFNFIGEGVFDFGSIMAAASLISLPPLLISMVAQKWLIEGIYQGAIR